MQFLNTYALLIAWTLFILVVPPLSAWLGGQDLGEYLRFPLSERAWDPLPFNPRVYWVSLGLAGGLVFLIMFLALGRTPGKRPESAPAHPGDFPPWGWLGPAGMAAGVGLAASGQAGAGLLSFNAGLMILLNADQARRSGHCLMTERVGYFLVLFGGGLLLGWLMHYLNLYLQNWTYPGLETTHTAVFVLGLSLHYALLLPLLLSLRQWLASQPWLLTRLAHGQSLNVAVNPDHGLLLLGLGVFGLVGAGLWPDRIYPLSWLAPLLLAIGLTLAAGRQTPFAGIRHGDWSRVVLTGLSGLLLGLLALAWNLWFTTSHQFSVSLLQLPGSSALPPPAYAQYPVLALLGLWVGDQLIPHWRKRPKKRFPDFPVRIRIE